MELLQYSGYICSMQNVSPTLFLLWEFDMFLNRQLGPHPMSEVSYSSAVNQLVLVARRVPLNYIT